MQGVWGPRGNGQVHRLAVIVGSERFNKPDDIFVVANLEDADFPENLVRTLVLSSKILEKVLIARASPVRR